MWRTGVPPHDNSVEYIDPRLLALTGGGVSESVPERATQLNDHDKLIDDVDNALADYPQEPEEIHERALGTPLRPVRQEEASSTPSVSPNAQHSSLRPDAEEFVPSRSPRPQLTLLTSTQEPEAQQQGFAAPKTPEIKVLAPDDCGFGSNVRARRTGQNRGRARTRSSPSRRQSVSLAGRKPAVFRVEQTRNYRNRPLGPIEPEEWINRDTYHPGDRFPLAQYLNAGAEPVNEPRVFNLCPSPSLVSGQGRGPFYCAFGGCKQRDKAWDTKSELKKHQRVHQPKEERRHPCPQCTRRFHYPKDVARHMSAKHQGGTPVSCQYCNKTLSRDDNLQRHIERVHGVICTPTSAVQTPSTAVASSAASPASPSISNCSDRMYDDASPSTNQTSPWSQAQGASRLFQQRLLLPAKLRGPLFPSPHSGPTSVPMTRGHTN